MLFNSIEFAIFLPIIFFLYWFVFSRNLILQNTLILTASYFFYAWWDYRFLALIIISSMVDFTVGLLIEKQKKSYKKKQLLYVSILVNLGFLGIFKYYNFFIENLIASFPFLFNADDIPTLSLILPVGISFYTFQTLSYSIDIYRGKIKPTKDILSFFSFVSFFPQLVAGPIERATSLLPQFFSRRIFEYDKAVDGLRQILCGLFKKIVIADNCAIYVNTVFGNSVEYSGSTLLLGALLFTFQIYGDFSGYSDIAIGIAQLFGFSLMRNFTYPYFSRDISEFWRRWHISLSSWFRDYLYIPLGGSRCNTLKKIRNIFTIFLLSGLWHGANWTFIFWGFLNALYYIPLMLLKRNRNNLEVVAKGKILPSFDDFIKIIFTFSLTVFAWIFFRAENIDHAFNYIQGIISLSTFSAPELLPGHPKSLIICIALFFSLEWLQREKLHALDISNLSLPLVAKYSIYYLFVGAILFLGGTQQDFIYFQF